MNVITDGRLHSKTHARDGNNLNNALFVISMEPQKCTLGETTTIQATDGDTGGATELLAWVSRVDAHHSGTGCTKRETFLQIFAERFLFLVTNGCPACRVMRLRTKDTLLTIVAIERQEINVDFGCAVTNAVVLGDDETHETIEVWKDLVGRQQQQQQELVSHLVNITLRNHHTDCHLLIQKAACDRFLFIKRDLDVKPLQSTEEEFCFRHHHTTVIEERLVIACGIDGMELLFCYDGKTHSMKARSLVNGTEATAINRVRSSYRVEEVAPVIEFQLVNGVAQLQYFYDEPIFDRLHHSQLYVDFAPKSDGSVIKLAAIEPPFRLVVKK